jgi:hypothetical protein
MRESREISHHPVPIVAGPLLIALLFDCSVRDLPAVRSSDAQAGGPGSSTAGFAMVDAGGQAGSLGFLTATFVPQVGSTVTRAVAPPAVSGGTLAVLHDGNTAVASDPDRDLVYIVDLAHRVVSATVTLQPGDEPGRVAEDGAGRVHVALRRGGALVTISSSGLITARRPVCAAPRGLAYDGATDLVHVACAGGELVSLPADGGAAIRTVLLDRDLRDVVIDSGRLLVTRFRTAEILSLGPDGTVTSRTTPPLLKAQMGVGQGQSFTASVAWRTIESPAGGLVMVHQRGAEDVIQSGPFAYGGDDACGAIVHTAVTTVQNGIVTSGPPVAGLVLPVDIAVSQDGMRVAIVSAGNATNAEGPAAPARLPRVFVTDLHSATDDTFFGCLNDGQHAPCVPDGKVLGVSGGTQSAGCSGTSTDGGPPSDSDGGVLVDSGASNSTDGQPPPTLPSSCSTLIDDGVDRSVPNVVGQPIAVAFDGSGAVVVQTREPASLQMIGGVQIVLSADSRADTGHALFHANAGGFVACASCHAEGNEDGRVWTFANSGPRRTQSVQTGLRGTEPFHWDGDEKDFPQLIADVFQGRMAGPPLMCDQVDAMLNWLDAQPRIPRPAAGDALSIERGKALFNDAQLGCATCHSGVHLTNNQTLDVGTGGTFQVPSLVGVASHPPFMHDGCAPTLNDRFTPACGGGDKHGVTSGLAPAQINDLVTFLETL